MNGPLERLTYFSRNLLRGANWRVAEEVDALLRVARIRNGYLRITGALLFHDDCFAQILEGDSEDLSWVFATITADPRHCDVTLLQRTPIAERAFPDWTMHYFEPECAGREPVPAAGDAGAWRGVISSLVNDDSCSGGGIRRLGPPFLKIGASDPIMEQGIPNY